MPRIMSRTLTASSKPCSVILCALDWYSAVRVGLGRHLQDVLASGTTLRRINIMLFAVDLPYNTGITLVKLSALFFYARVFKVFRLIIIFLWITGTLVVSWWIVFNLTSICTCSPPRKQWDTSVEGHCLDLSSLYVATATSNVLIDLIILVLPLPMLRKLQVTLPRKMALVGAFTLGYW